MKTTFRILLIILTVMTVWTACQFDILNSFLSGISVVLLIVGYIFSTILDSIDERAD